ncbi:hypothetical protein M1615_01165 [Patescibacteria group bacterium]|nr:hypothetical protein [Patescibacteria group bacterium]MCL5010150.1 hypothetical protein [Patescibacteria group bacterium]
METQGQEQSLIHDFNKQSNNNSFFSLGLIIFIIVAIVFGIGTGYALSKHGTGTGGIMRGFSLGAAPKIVGSNDLKTFKDTAEGVLKNGGIDGEGQYHLVRPGGASQNVYLTSSTLDLSKFINKKLKVWGQTQKAQHAGWLMDVGRVEILN